MCRAMETGYGTLRLERRLAVLPHLRPRAGRPECTGLELESVRIPHTVKALPYNYCNENEYQRVSGYRREFFAPKEWQAARCC